MKLPTLFFVGALPLLVSSPQAGRMKALDLCDYKPFFLENFDTLSVASRVLGGSRWIAHTPWNGDFGDAVFVDDAPWGPFAVEDGLLRITARKDATGKWRSGLLAAADGTGAGQGVRYGYFEARMRFPPGPGTWPAFWLATKKPRSDLTPGIEIDVIEYYGHADAAYSSALHVWYEGDQKSRSRHVVHKTAAPSGSLVETFHTYGVRVSPETITYYLDREPVWQMPTPAEHVKPLSPLVNLALGSGFPIDKTPNPSVLLVDYVHVYEADPQSRGARCPGARQ